MAKGKLNVCDTCGAAVSSDRCDLCGTPVADATDFDEVSEAAESGELEVADEQLEQPERASSVGHTSKLVCQTCGAANRYDARFCDQCGDTLGAPESRKPPKPARPLPKKAKAVSQNGTGTQSQPRIGLYVAVAIAAVIGLYALSLMSNSPSRQTSPERGMAQASQSAGSNPDTYLPEDDGLATTLAPTKAAIQAATDPAQQQQLQEELVQSYAGVGRLDLAGREQEVIAGVQNSAEAWAKAGNMHFDWMEGQSGPERVSAAQRAARAYEKALELEPENLDVRTDLGVAYLNDPASPMLAIQNTNLVLEADSNHVQANFNKGVMLAQIGRTQEAIRLFRKVTQLSKSGDPANERARQILGQLGAPESVSGATE